ncbi:GLPGLI family protein [Flavobacterium croceum DSM 17960]|uniref:GLPGLI family protein n=1 Tax=Flavobacterium croceum DSM 17960 TaxID=1121886 RepID=A0A2S4N6S2_9FLAO|nr:GLPGLI family protein [Flavobacterium croceum]POS01394.1 GLPGLI family protein [Flavobacterium croceum DSM 17960]
MILRKIKFLLFIFILCNTLLLHAQKSTTVIYNIALGGLNRVDMHAKDTIKKDVPSKFLKNQEKIQFSLVFDSISSIYQIVDKLEEKSNHDYRIATIINGGTLVYYKNNKQKEKMYQAELQGQKFNVSVPFQQYNWEITSETKVVNGFKCYKAITTIEKIDKGRETTTILHPVVWFTPDIPSSFGPMGLDGLPGLVLEGTLDGIKYLYATKINLNTTDKVDKPNKGMEVTESEFQDINAKIYREIQKIKNNN